MENNKNFSTTCPKCGYLCFVQLYESDPQKLLVKCKCQNDFYPISIHDFIQQCTLNTTHAKDSNHCQKYPNEIVEFFCVTCQRHICRTCKDSDEHLGHTIIDVKDYLNDNVLADIQEKFTETQTFVNDYMLKLKDSSVSVLKSIIQDIEKAYERNCETNKNILSLFKVLLEDYLASDRKNFVLAYNLKSNSNFTKEEYASAPGDYREVIRYFNTNYVVPIKEVNLETFTLSVQPIKPYEKQIKKIIILKDLRVLINSTTNEIKIYNKDLTEVSTTIKATNQKEYFYCVAQHPNGKILTSLSDATVNIWEPKGEDFVSVREFLGNIELVFDIAPLTEDRFAVCGKDLSISIWSINPPYNSICYLNKQNSWINALLQLSNGKLVSSSDYGSSIMFWNLKNYQSEGTIKDVSCYTGKKMIECENTLIIERKEEIVMLDIQTFKIIQRIADAELIGLISSSVILRDFSLLFSAEKCSFVNYSIRKNHISYSKQTVDSDQSKRFTALTAADKNELIVGDEKGNVMVYRY